MTAAPLAEADPVAPPEIPIPPQLGLAIVAARDALDHAADLCRMHGDVPPTKPGAWSGSCQWCEQPARVRKALALLRRAAGEAPPVRRYVVDDTGTPCRVSGLFPVLDAHGRPVRGLFAPDDPGHAGAVIERELDIRGELGPFDIVVTLWSGER